VLVILLSSCESRLERLNYYHYITNQTNKEIIHIQTIDDSDVKEKILDFYVKGKTEQQLEWTISYIKGSEQGGFGIAYTNYFLYNISDTTSYTKDFNCDDSFFHVELSEGEYERKNHTSNSIYNCYLTVNDSLLKLMKKDYTMLEKFKEYYQK
jgi:hypothetical protein